MRIEVPTSDRVIETGAMIGRGQFSDVYVAGQDLAVKVYTRQQAAGFTVEDGLRRALWAGEALASMAQDSLMIAPGIAAVVVVDDQGQDWPGLLMRRVHGVNSADWLAAHPPREARLHLLFRLLTGLARMHDLDVAHNDISFGNVLISDGPALLDFDRAGEAPPALLRDGMFYAQNGTGIAHDLRAFAILTMLMLEGVHPFSDDLPGLLQGKSGFKPVFRPPARSDWAQCLGPALGLADGLRALDLLRQWPRGDH